MLKFGHSHLEGTLRPDRPPPPLNTPAHARRYSETQTARNGLRYRDWVCTYASDQCLEKCRLEAHILAIAQLHEAVVPWRRSSQRGRVEWILVRSSLPVEQRVLNDRNANPMQIPLPDAVPRFTAFIRSAKARFLQDLKGSLPVENPDSDAVQRTNVTFYEDERGQQILVVYAPDASQRLEFIHMTLLPEPGA